MSDVDVTELRAQIERLKIRGAAYERAYGIAYQATYQSHTGHWDRTGGSGPGCPECIRAREARENCDAEIREGLAALVERARSEAPADCDSKATSLEPGASEQVEQRSPGRTQLRRPEPIARRPGTG